MASKYGRSNPLLTNLSLARRNAKEGYIAEFVSPTIPTNGKSFGEYNVFDERSFFQLPDNEIADGNSAREVFLQASVQNYKCRDFGSKASYTQKEMDDFGGSELDLQTAKMNMVTDADMNAHEYRVGTLVTTAASYASANKTTLTGTDQWSDVSSDPFNQIVDAKVAIKTNAGVEPNAMVVSYQGFWQGLAKHPDIISRVQAMQKDSGFTQMTPQVVGGLLGVDLRVASAVYLSSNPGKSTTTHSFIWGDYALVFHRNQMAAINEINLSYTFSYKNFEMRTYYDEDKDRYYVSNKHTVDSKLVAAGVGYLISDTIA